MINGTLDLRCTIRATNNSFVLDDMFPDRDSTSAVAKNNPLRGWKRSRIWLSSTRLRLYVVVVALAAVTLFSVARGGETNNVSNSSSNNDKQLPAVLTRQGAAVSVPDVEDKYIIPPKGGAGPVGKLKFVGDRPGMSRVPRADGDEAIWHIAENLIRIGDLCSNDKNNIVIDVGGLYGDFGMSTAAVGCQTVIYEPQRAFAERIAGSIILNSLQDVATVHNGAVSNEKELVETKGGGGTTFFQKQGDEANQTEAAIADVVLIPTERLDDLLNANKRLKVFFLKIDVEGFEDVVLDTAQKLFRDRHIQHVVLEFTPFQFQGRGTDYSKVLPKLYETLGAKECFCCHRKLPKIFRIRKGDEKLFYDEMFKIHMQTDIYCYFDESFDISHLNIVDWSPSISLTKRRSP